MNKFIASAAVTLMLASNVCAQENSIIQGWAGTAVLGATRSTGNSESSSTSGSLRLGKTSGQWEHLAFGSVNKGTSSIVVTDPDGSKRVVKGDSADRVALGYQPKYYWKERTYFFGILDWETDKPSDIDVGTRQIVGIGHKFFTDDRGFLSGELGVGNKTQDLVSGGDNDSAIGYYGLNYLRKISDTISFNADLRGDFGSDNNFTELGLGLAFKISEGMAIKISHFTRNNSNIADTGNPLSSSSDSVTSFNLVIDI